MQISVTGWETTRIRMEKEELILENQEVFSSMKKCIKKSYLFVCGIVVQACGEAMLSTLPYKAPIVLLLCYQNLQ